MEMDPPLSSDFISEVRYLWEDWSKTIKQALEKHSNTQFVSPHLAESFAAFYTTLKMWDTLLRQAAAITQEQKYKNI